jgi:hypothetical protein
MAKKANSAAECIDEEYARTSWAEGMHAPNGEGTPLHETDLVGNFRRLVAGEITRSACGPVVMQRDRLVVS